jgi:hypothetical protein
MHHITIDLIVACELLYRFDGQNLVKPPLPSCDP